MFSNVNKSTDRCSDEFDFEVNIKGNSRQNRYPDECCIINKTTGEKWSVEFHLNFRSGQREARLKDKNGSFLEKCPVFQGRVDWIDAGCSSYGPVWGIANDALEAFQKRHCNHVESERRRNDAYENSLLRTAIERNFYNGLLD